MSTMSVLSWSNSVSGKRSKSETRRSWTRDPQKNKCDWTLQVKRLSGRRDTYYIHKKVVEDLGERRTPYFEKIFRDEAQRVGDRESLLEASDEVADKFPLYLDFLYCKSKEEEEQLLLNVQNGLDLCNIAEYYGITSLRSMLSKYYRDKTLAFNVIGLINETKNSETDDMLESELHQFALTMHANEYVDEDQLEPSFLLRALRRRKKLGIPINRTDSENISCLIALCTQRFKHQLTRTLFYKLTFEEYIPFIDQEAALQLLVTEEEHGYWIDYDNFSSVQGRCIRALLSDWTGLRDKFESDNTFWRTLRRLSPSILGILLMHSTNTARGTEEIKDSGRTIASDSEGGGSVRTAPPRIRLSRIKDASTR